MNRALYFLVLLGFLALTGCGFLDGLTGVGPDGSVGPSLLGGAAKTASSMPGLLGLIGTLATGAFGIYQTARARKLGNEQVNYKEALTAVVEGIDKALVQGTKLTVTKEEVYEALNRMKVEIMSNPQFLTQFVNLVKGASRKT